MRRVLVSALIFLFSAFCLAACSAENIQTILSEQLGIDVSEGREISNYDTHSGNGDGTSYIVLDFENDDIVEKIKNNPQWKTFPLDETVRTLVYGVENRTGKIGPYLSDQEGNPLVPEIENGYYMLIDRQAEKNTATGADILHRGSFNFTLGLYDADRNRLYFCQLDT